tara:strand:- start:462 stop:1646 length:1185 start_codon:yes stop_codon:yes gene_type:complete
LEAVLVPFKKNKIAIINRSFWPVYPVIGEALLQIAEELAIDNRVSVVMQDHVGIKKKLDEHKRGKNVRFYPVKAWTTSASGILGRILDNVYFMAAVSLILMRVRPDLIYISTDPPILIPYIVMVYCFIFRKKYIYHVQDIHPEATKTILPMNKLIYNFLYQMDNTVVRRANKVITITNEMADELLNRMKIKRLINLVENPSISFENVLTIPDKIKGFSFCGNAGRLQRIPLLILAIEKYLDQGGTLEFAFAGSGIFKNELKSLAIKYKNVKFYGLVTADEAAQINANYSWAILSIKDEITRYAFPSKSSSYAVSGALILAICGNATSVAQWVKSNRLGIVAEPDISSLVDVFHKIEHNDLDTENFDMIRESLIERLSFKTFILKLNHHIMGSLS